MHAVRAPKVFQQGLGIREATSEAKIDRPSSAKRPQAKLSANHSTPEDGERSGSSTQVAGEHAAHKAFWKRRRCRFL